MSKAQWLPLSPGDSIQMIAPGMPFDRTQLKAGEKILGQWGVQLKYPRHILGKDIICSNSRSERIRFLKAAIESDSKVIWAARGGYGSVHLLEALAKMKKPRSKKLLVGFSDICTLQQFVTQEWGWPVLHGPHIDRLGALSSIRKNELRKILFGHQRELIFKKLQPLNAAARKSGRVRGVVTGGNMITTQATFGTDWQIDTAGKILFFEDIGERGYKIDRVLQHMEFLGVLKKCKAVIFGPFTGGAEPNGRDKVPLVLKEFAASVRVPVFRGLASGHIPNSLALPMNTTAVLRKGNGAELRVETGCKL